MVHAQPRITHGDWIHLGCGIFAPEQWPNFDYSPTRRLQQNPLVGMLIPAETGGRCPRAGRHGAIVRGLPVPSHKVSLVYSSHVLGRLSPKDLRRALRNIRRMIRPGAVFRSVLPDLEHLIKAYAANSIAATAFKFLARTLLGERQRLRGLERLARQWLGNSRLIWMRVYKSLAAELQAGGLTGARRAEFQESDQDTFRLVEIAGRCENALGVECRA